MKILKTYTNYALGLSLTFILACSTSPVSVELGVDTSSIQLGTQQANGFVQRTDKTFSASDKIILKVKARGLAIKEGKIKVNIDLFLKKDKDILGTENDILGKDGFTKSVQGVDSAYTANTGEADLEIGIIPPSDTTGELATNVTLRDLNTSGKLVSFETKLNIKRPEVAVPPATTVQ